MERYGEYITFNADEQSNFAVDEVVSIESAQDTAATFTGIASGLQLRAEALVGDSSREAEVRRKTLLSRAVELNTFATAIGRLCSPPEIDQLIDRLRDR